MTARISCSSSLPCNRTGIDVVSRYSCSMGAPAVAGRVVVTKVCHGLGRPPNTYRDSG